MHTPVLLKEAIESLNIKLDGVYIDATAGEGGHLTEIAKTAKKVLGIDWDKSQVENLKKKLGNIKNIEIVPGNFAEIGKIAKENGFADVDGILFDFGLSMNQLSSSGRGFSFKREDEPLDMRISEENERTAEEIVNVSSEEELYDIFARYGEEIYSRPIARAIVARRIRTRLKNVGDLVRAIVSGLKSQRDNEETRTLTRIFQALRIAVNDEFENLRSGLNQAYEILKSGGVLSVITFHSLEDRLVKQFVREKNMIQRPLIRGSYEFKFERSAKLRSAIKSI